MRIFVVKHFYPVADPENSEGGEQETLYKK